MMSHRACTPPRGDFPPRRSNGTPHRHSSHLNPFGEVNTNIMPPRQVCRVERRLGLDDDDDVPYGDSVEATSASYSTPRGSWPQVTTNAAAQEEGRCSHNSVNAFPTASDAPSGRPSLRLPAMPHDWQTPVVDRTTGGSVRMTGGCFGLPVVPALLYTPQIAPESLSLRRALDSELNEVNMRYSTDTLPPVTPLIPGKLYIGGFPDDETLPILRREGIRYIINCAAGDYYTERAVAAEFKVYDICANDAMDYLILHHDLEVFSNLVTDIIETKQEKVFVHCIAGINRSVTLCGAYLMDKYRQDPIEVVKLFRANGRHRILDNVNFRHQLVDHYLHVVQPENRNEEE